MEKVDQWLSDSFLNLTMNEDESMDIDRLNSGIL